MRATSSWSAKIIAEHHISEIVHFAGSIVVPESVSNPLKYYANNTATSRNLIEAAVAGGVKHFIFSSTAAVYGMTGLEPVSEDTTLSPMSPYGRSKLMTEMMLADVAAAHPITYGVLRYFNVAGADPQKRSGQSTPFATHLIKVTVQTALGQRDHVDIFGTDYPDAGRHRRPRLHPRHRPRSRRMRCCSSTSATAGEQRDPQLRLRPGLLGAAGDRHGAAGLGRRVRRCAKGRAGQAIRPPSSPKRARSRAVARVEAGARRPPRDRRVGVQVGTLFGHTESVAQLRREGVPLAAMSSVIRVCTDLLAAIVVLALLSAWRASRSSPSTDFIRNFESRAVAAGVSREFYRLATDGLTPDPNVPDLVTTQPEFTTPMWDYIEGRVIVRPHRARQARDRQQRGAVRGGGPGLRRRSLHPRRDLGDGDGLWRGARQRQAHPAGDPLARDARPPAARTAQGGRGRLHRGAAARRAARRSGGPRRLVGRRDRAPSGQSRPTSSPTAPMATATGASISTARSPMHWRRARTFSSISDTGRASTGGSRSRCPTASTTCSPIARRCARYRSSPSGGLPGSRAATLPTSTRRSSSTSRPARTGRNS